MLRILALSVLGFLAVASVCAASASAAIDVLSLSREKGFCTIDGKPVMALKLGATNASGSPISSDKWEDKLVVEQKDASAITLSLPAELGLRLTVTGKVTGKDIFPCTPESVKDQLPMVRSVSGLSHNALNTGVCSRPGDWSVMFDADSLEITADEGKSRGKLCHVTASGPKLEVTFERGLYRVGRGLTYYHPEKYELPTFVPCGWISWKAYGAGITEKNMRDVADWAAKTFKDYGLEYLTLDDGWFVGSHGGMLHSVPANVDWTKGNDRFSSGMKALADYIHSKGLKAGIWISPFGCSTKEIIADHPDWFVHKGKDGPVLESGWHGRAFVDGTSDEAISQWLTRGIKAQLANGFDYFKLDGQKHVAYDAYKNTGDYFCRRARRSVGIQGGIVGLFCGGGGGVLIGVWRSSEPTAC